MCDVLICFELDIIVLCWLSPIFNIRVKLYILDSYAVALYRFFDNLNSLTNLNETYIVGGGRGGKNLTN